jgi:hypothetical protein
MIDSSTGAVTTTVFGLDWVTRVDAAYAPTDDLVASGDSSGLLPLDPDPVALSSGTVRVHLGMQDATSGETDALVVVEGSSSDIIVWPDAWV